MAAPVIAFNSFTAATEIIKHGETGYLTAYGDYPAIVEALKQTEKLSVAAIQTTFESFSNDCVFAQWDKLIVELDAETADV